MAFFDFLFKEKPKTVKQIIIDSFYADYPEIPYISDDRPKDWIEKAKCFPKQSIVQKSIMKRYADGLLPGHIYMLYWLKKYTNKNVPSYFEYKYGINFEKEKTYLYEKGYIDSINKPTEKGEKAIKKHYKIIENHSPKRDNSIEAITKQILAQCDGIRKNGFKEYRFNANRNCCEICAELNGKHFLVSELEIGKNAPPMHEGCSCSISAYQDRREYEAWLNSL